MSPQSTNKSLGRPPANPEEVRAHRVATFVTEHEWRTLRTIADQRDLSVSRLVHDTLIEGLFVEN
jgi:hypothetical protein